VCRIFVRSAEGAITLFKDLTAGSGPSACAYHTPTASLYVTLGTPGGLIRVTDVPDPQIEIIDLASFTSPAVGNLAGIAFDTRNAAVMYVSDSINNRLLRLEDDSQGWPVTAMWTTAPTAMQFQTAHGALLTSTKALTIDPTTNTLYVAAEEQAQPAIWSITQAQREAAPVAGYQMADSICQTN
jgi:hypothetical protein